MAGSSRSQEITPNRLEAFSDGVIAIIITIMVLELKVPHSDTLEGLGTLWPKFLSYALSFLLVAEYWMNHHLLFTLICRVDNRVLWSNLLLLFTISLIPFFTAFMGENHISAFSVMAYSACTCACSFVYLVLLTAIFRECDETGAQRSLRRSAYFKSITAIVIYGCAVPAALVHPALSLALNFVVGMMYFLPDAWLTGTRRKR
jgi:uncharacterized membrane protein